MQLRTGRECVAWPMLADVAATLLFSLAPTVLWDTDAVEHLTRLQPFWSYTLGIGLVLGLLLVGSWRIVQFLRTRHKVARMTFVAVYIVGMFFGPVMVWSTWR